MKDKFYNALPQWVNWEDAEKCEQIADEFAIGFAEFIESKCEIRLHEPNTWYYNGGAKLIVTTKQLLEIYKQSLK